MNKLKIIFCSLLISVLFCSSLYSQNNTVTGYVTDENNEALIGVNIVLKDRDSLFVDGTTTNSLGRFVLSFPQKDGFTLAFSYLGYKSESRDFKNNRKNVDLGTVVLKKNVEILDEVDVVELNPAVKLLGDTTEFSANSYKVAANATAEDLILKMPGITLEDGVVKAHGEEVQKVYVDGKEFFGDDASIAFKNIPADIIEKIQVYDKMSDMAEFTGFRDGETTKTVNIKTYSNMNNGWFGKLTGAYGNGNLYSAGGNLNYFKDDMRISLIGLSNNVNQQNFSMQDMIGIASSSGSRGGPPMGGGNSNVPGPPDNGDNSQGNTMSNYFVGQNGGINKVNSFGINYVDAWSSKINVSASYFFNSSGNKTTSLTNRDYLLSGEDVSNYLENQDYASSNFNHRFKLKFDYKINDKNTLVITPGLNFQKMSSESVSDIVSSYNSIVSSSNASVTSNNYNALSFNNSILYRHKFAKTGRTISLNVLNDISNRNGESLMSSEAYYSSLTDSIFTNQKTESLSSSNTMSANVSYTEPLGEFSQLMLSINPSYSESLSDKNVFNGDTGFENLVIDSVLTDYYSFQTYRTKAGTSYRYNKNKVNLNFGVDFQNLSLVDNLTDDADNGSKTYNSILPKLNMFYNIDKGKFFHLNISSNTSTPTISQLQDVIDNSNTSVLVQGNPDLDQQRTNSVHLAFRTIDKSFNKSLFFVISGQMSDNYIVSTNYTALTDSILSDGVILYSGSQLNSYKNMSGYKNLRSFVTFSLPLKFIRSSFSFNGGYSWSQLPGLVNNVSNITNSDYLFGGVSVNSNISDKVDFRVSYSSGYNMLENKLQPTSDYNYYSGKLTGKANLVLLKKLNVSSDISYNHYLGEQSVSDNNNLIWNAGLGFMFLKNSAAEIKLSAYDILNQNNSYSQNITSAYVERVYTNVLQRYFLVSFTYNLKNFAIEDNFHNGGPPPPPF